MFFSLNRRKEKERAKVLNGPSILREGDVVGGPLPTTMSKTRGKHPFMIFRIDEKRRRGQYFPSFSWPKRKNPKEGREK